MFKREWRGIVELCVHLQVFAGLLVCGKRLIQRPRDIDIHCLGFPWFTFVALNVEKSVPWLEAPYHDSSSSIIDTSRLVAMDEHIPVRSEQANREKKKRNNRQPISDKVLAKAAAQRITSD